MVPSDIWVSIVDTWLRDDEVDAFCTAFPQFTDMYRASGGQSEITIGNRAVLTSDTKCRVFLRVCTPQVVSSILRSAIARDTVHEIHMNDCLLGRQQLQLLRKLIKLKGVHLNTLVISPLVTDFNGSEDSRELKALCKTVSQLTNLRRCCLSSTVTQSSLNSILPRLQDLPLVELALDGIRPSSPSAFITRLNVLSTLTSLSLSSHRLRHELLPCPSLRLPCLRTLSLQHFDAACIYPYSITTVRSLNIRTRQLFPPLPMPRVELPIECLSVFCETLRYSDAEHLLSLLDWAPRLRMFDIGCLWRPSISALFVARFLTCEYLSRLRHLTIRTTRHDSCLVHLMSVLYRRGIHVQLRMVDAS